MTWLRDSITDVLTGHGVEPSEELVTELVQVAKTQAWWDDDQVVDYVGTIVPASVRAYCSRYRIPRRVLMPADDVVSLQTRRRGWGRRKDDHG